MSFPVTERIAKSARHTAFYLACGDAHRPVIIFVHGWPELSMPWDRKRQSGLGMTGEAR